jgi:nucleolar MIF4G domain-containing protein 1
MGSTDYEDAFEKLVRTGMLKNRTERDTVRVLMECCGNEKAYNSFYSHLAARICEYQPQCRFTFQLAYWDAFKQFDSMKLRKAANLAKLLYHLVAEHNILKLSILRVIDMSPDTVEETATIFLTIFFSSVFEHFDDPSDVRRLFDCGIPRRREGVKMEDDEQMEQFGADEGLRESLSVFFLKILQTSPKNKKKSKFRANLKAAVKACEMDEFDSMIPL